MLRGFHGLMALNLSETRGRANEVVPIPRLAAQLPGSAIRFGSYHHPNPQGGKPIFVSPEYRLSGHNVTFAFATNQSGFWLDTLLTGTCCSRLWTVVAGQRRSPREHFPGRRKETVPAWDILFRPSQHYTRSTPPTPVGSQAKGSKEGRRFFSAVSSYFSLPIHRATCSYSILGPDPSNLRVLYGRYER
ncbi:hypothetical protein BV22DRAFT_213181 [Leucogyrophana mollusca]|uniref:Uncharacterized protein n=1 Tax=Leucogyrophana mollusca TaxID=85980 RepID=A0ACB8BT53_9AGAM|nr:hypothetical protein BV22DRAFT_213181 [Leucogyrophana mollusca]